MSEKAKVLTIANAPTPYRTFFHDRLRREIEEVDFHCAYTHRNSKSKWSQNDTADKNAMYFTNDNSTIWRSALKGQVSEFIKGGSVCKWISANAVRALIVGGYNDLGRIRVFRYAKRKKIPCFLFADSNSRCDFAMGLKRAIKYLVVRWVISKCSGIFVCGHLGRDYFLSYGACAERIFLVPYEPDYALFSTRETETTSEIAEQYKIPMGKKIFLFAGRLVREKRPDLVVNAFVSIADSRPGWDLMMIGTGEQREALLSLVPPRLRRRVHWLGFVSNQRVLASLFQLCDLLVLPSDYEPWGVVVNEAAASGLAVIASDRVGAANELVTNNVNGLVIKSGSQQQLVAAMLDCSDEFRLPTLKKASASILAAWRSAADPVTGVRQALKGHGILG